MKAFPTNSLVVVLCLAMLTLLCFAWFSPQSIHADQPTAKPADERPVVEDVKPESVNNKEKKVAPKEVVPVDLGGGVYLVEIVIAGNPGNAEKYQAAYVKFCKEHPDSCIEVSTARETGLGVTTARFWRVVGKPK